jgi:peptidoglycan/xylan/chitin deacetylase (PgdA/CDA1 family)
MPGNACEVSPVVRRRDVLAGGLAVVYGAALAACSRPASPPTAHASGTSGGDEPTASVAPRPTGSGTPRPSTPSSSSALGSADLVSGPRTSPQVALTFHGAGSADLTRQALAALGAAGAHVTVFAVGSWLVGDPQLATLVLAGGHELGNHTMHHLPMRTLGSAQATAEVQGCAAELRRVTGSSGRWFRPSGTPRSTSTIRAAARSAGYERCVSYDVDSLDWTDPGPDAVVRRVLGAVRPGSIVSLHLGHAGTVAALPRILTGLDGHGLRPVTVSALVGAQ